jgi:hypothetical protein
MYFNALFFKIFDLKVWEKHIFSPKNICFCDEKPTLDTHISKNKRERSTFLFDPGRTNIVLLGSNKKLTSGPLFFKIFDLKIWEIHIFLPKVCHIKFFL